MGGVHLSTGDEWLKSRGLENNARLVQTETFPTGQTYKTYLRGYPTPGFRLFLLYIFNKIRYTVHECGKSFLDGQDCTTFTILQLDFPLDCSIFLAFPGTSG